MISYVEGPLVIIEEDVIVVEAGYVGLAIHAPVPLLPELPGMGKGIMVYIYFQIREGVVALYGFPYGQDKDMFRQSLEVSDIRSKDTLGVLFVLRPDDLHLAIVSEDVKVLTKVPNIGNKTARRLILDLKDRIFMDDVLGDMVGRAGMDAVNAGVSVVGSVETAREAVQALVALGYTSAEASGAVKQVKVTDGITSGGVLKASLKHLSFL